MKEVKATTLKMNCIDCHMPQQPSRAITFQLSGDSSKSAYLLRTHKIAVYLDANSKRFLGDIKSIKAYSQQPKP
jgi:hypothetical protein